MLFRRLHDGVGECQRESFVVVPGVPLVPVMRAEGLAEFAQYYVGKSGCWQKTNGPVFAGPSASSHKGSALEADLRAQLNNARIARAGHLAKGAGAERGVQRRVVGVVESIECFQPELR